MPATKKPDTQRAVRATLEAARAERQMIERRRAVAPVTRTVYRARPMEEASPRPIT